MCHLIHDTPAYRLESKVTRNRFTGKTLELYVTHPLAQRPRSQRIACLTLPDEAFARLASACLHKDEEEAP